MFQMAFKAPDEEKQERYEMTRYRVLNPNSDPLPAGNLRQDTISSLKVITNWHDNDFLKFDYDSVINPFSVKSTTALKFNDEVRGCEFVFQRPVEPAKDQSKISIKNGDTLDVSYGAAISTNNDRHVLHLGAFGYREHQKWKVEYGSANTLTAIASAVALT